MKDYLNPFSLTELISYIIPGSFGLFMLIHLVDSEVLNIEALTSLRKLELGDSKWLLFFILSYLNGHLLSLASSFLIERYSIIVFSFPSKYLLFPEEHGAISPKMLEKFFNFNSNYKIVPRLFLLVFLFPLIFLDCLGLMLGWTRYIYRSFDKPTRGLSTKLFIELLNRIFPREYHKNEDIKFNGDSDYFQPLYHFLISKSDVHFRRTSNYVSLYGFFRSMSFLFLSISWILMIINVSDLVLSLLFMCNRGDCFAPANQWIILYHVMLNILDFHYLFLIAMAYLCYLGFVKFNRRFSLEVMYGVISVGNEILSDSKRGVFNEKFKPKSWVVRRRV